jgi:hypothetical protein
VRACDLLIRQRTKEPHGELLVVFEPFWAFKRLGMKKNPISTCGDEFYVARRS